MTSEKGTRSHAGPLPQPFFWRLHPDGLCEGVSLAEYLARELSIPPHEASDLIDFGSVQVDGRQARSGAMFLKGVSEVRVYPPYNGTRRHYEIDVRRILHRDTCLLAYDKEAGIPSQQTPSDAYNNVFAALKRYLAAERIGEPYVALHHRLDRETSGILLVSLMKKANRTLGGAFAQRKIRKDYLAWVLGHPRKDYWTASEDIGRKGGRYCTLPKGTGKSAETAFWVLWRESGRTLVHGCPVTGRTHQIRLHLAAHGTPVLGDTMYGGGREDRLYLHAWRLTIVHPSTGKTLHLTAPVPPDWKVPVHVILPPPWDFHDSR
ncbi:MAG: RluA family pseudouridine synthase [Deltaproteobacteria bacterium]|nr:RluA family pseudouridine synthase [Deltaproteobacteria bacterium]